MCGITGFLNFDGRPVDTSIISKMTKAIAHRGPDGENIWQEGPLSVGHLRLAIIDPTADSDQPMFSSDKRYVLAFNGEIYNFRDLRRELEMHGVNFVTKGDTEVLLQALICWGEDALIKLNGMFSFIFVDRKERTLILARDRFGVKPLYYCIQNGVLAFGSEIKAILAHPQFNARLNAQGLAEYLSFMNFLSDQTLFKDIRLVPAGTSIKLNFDTRLENGQALDFKRFWDFRFSGEDRSFDADALADEIHAAFKTAVQRQLVSDVGKSTYLSGGIDSGAITAIASSLTENLRTFTAGFDTSMAGVDSHFDERDAAKLMSKVFETEHHELVITADDFERTLVPLCRQLEEPRVGQSYPNYLVSELASSFEKVVLSGCGGDELFGGYPWRYFNGFPAKNFEQFCNGYYAYWRRLAKTDAELTNLLNPIKSEVGDFSPYDVFKSIFPDEAWSANTNESMLNWALYFEAKTFMNGLLVVEDKVAMAHSLETRVPFLDNDLVDLACRTSIHAKISDIDGSISDAINGNAQEKALAPRSDGKVVLRHMISRLVPEQIHKAKKMGFSAPDESWFRNESKDFIGDKLLSKNRRIFDILDRREIESVVQSHWSGNNERHKIWAFLNLAETFDAYGL